MLGRSSVKRRDAGPLDRVAVLGGALNDIMTESGLLRDSSVTPGLSRSRSMMRVADRSVKPCSGLVCTKWPAKCASRRQHVERGTYANTCVERTIQAQGAGAGGAPRKKEPPFSSSSERSSTATKLAIRCRCTSWCQNLIQAPISQGRIASPCVCGEADLGAGLIRNAQELLHLVGLEMAVLIAADDATDVEEDDAEWQARHWLFGLRRRCPAGGRACGRRAWLHVGRQNSGLSQRVTKTDGIARG